jgi:hypothetical protein
MHHTLSAHVTPRAHCDAVQLLRTGFNQKSPTPTSPQVYVPLRVTNGLGTVGRQSLGWQNARPLERVCLTPALRHRHVPSA